MLKLSKIWTNRLREFEAHCNTNDIEWLTYNDMSEIAGISRSNISVKLAAIGAACPEAIESKTQNGAKIFKIEFDMLLEQDSVEDGPDIPDWLAENSYNNLIERFSDNAPDGFHLEFERYGLFDKRFQRGGVLAKLYEDGQKHSDWEEVVRLDNCIVLG